MQYLNCYDLLKPSVSFTSLTSSLFIFIFYLCCHWRLLFFPWRRLLLSSWPQAAGTSQCHTAKCNLPNLLLHVLKKGLILASMKSKKKKSLSTSGLLDILLWNVISRQNIMQLVLWFLIFRDAKWGKGDRKPWEDRRGSEGVLWAKGDGQRAWENVMSLRLLGADSEKKFGGKSLMNDSAGDYISRSLVCFLSVFKNTQ